MVGIILARNLLKLSDAYDTFKKMTQEDIV